MCRRNERGKSKSPKVPRGLRHFRFVTVSVENRVLITLINQSADYSEFEFWDLVQSQIHNFHDRSAKNKVHQCVLNRTK